MSKRARSVHKIFKDRFICQGDKMVSSILFTFEARVMRTKNQAEKV